MFIIFVWFSIPIYIQNELYFYYCQSGNNYTITWRAFVAETLHVRTHDYIKLATLEENKFFSVSIFSIFESRWVSTIFLVFTTEKYSFRINDALEFQFIEIFQSPPTILYTSNTKRESLLHRKKNNKLNQAGFIFFRGLIVVENKTKLSNSWKKNILS
jgi:hypothetical protein